MSDVPEFEKRLYLIRLKSGKPVDVYLKRWPELANLKEEVKPEPKEEVKEEPKPEVKQDGKKSKRRTK